MELDKKRYNTEEFREIVKSNTSIGGVIKSLGLKVSGSNYETIRRKIKELGIDTGHFVGRGWSKGISIKENSVTLKELMLRSFDRIDKCKICGIKGLRVNEEFVCCNCYIGGNAEKIETEIRDMDLDEFFK